jgi:hypothetical protein
MTKGKLLTTPSRMLKFILPLTTRDTNIDRKDVEPLALLVHPQQPLSYLERLIQSELPALENGQPPRVTFRAEDSGEDDKPTRSMEADEKQEKVEQSVESAEAGEAAGKAVKVDAGESSPSASDKSDKMDSALPTPPELRPLVAFDRDWRLHPRRCARQGVRRGCGERGAYLRRSAEFQGPHVLSPHAPA